MSSRDFKPLAYYYIRRGWHDQLNVACEKKGKDNLGITTFWRAYGTGAAGNVSECIRMLSNFQTRPDMQYPVSLALVYFHQKAQQVDHDALSGLRSSLSVSEDVAKEVGLVLAARFSLITGDMTNAMRICVKVLSRTNDASTPGELEATTIMHWIYIYNYLIEGGGGGGRSESELMQIEDFIRRKNSIMDVDLDDLMAWYTSKCVIGDRDAALNILNQITAGYSSFMPAYAEKALLLSSSMLHSSRRTGSGPDANWTDIIDLAFKLSDEYRSIDGDMIVAIHDLTQDMHMHSAIEKLVTLENTMSEKEPNNAGLYYDIASLFLRISYRQPRAQQICTSMLQKCVQLQPHNSMYICELGYAYLLQCQYTQAIKYYRDAGKRDPNNLAAIEGMILAQIMQGQYEDAEAQVELISVMHSGNDEDISAEYSFILALLAYHSSGMHQRDLKTHVEALNACKAKLSNSYDSLVLSGPGYAASPVIMTNGGNIYSTLTGGSCCLRNELVALNPDLMLQVGASYMLHLEPATNFTFKSSPSSTGSGSDSSASSAAISELAPAVKSGVDVLTELITKFPSCLSGYIELSRAYLALGMHDAGLNVLNQYLDYHGNENDLPQECSVILLFKAKIEISRSGSSSNSAGSTNNNNNIFIAEKLLEQSLSNDFSIRSQPIYKLIQIMVFSQQPHKYTEALQSIEQLISGHPMEFKSIGGDAGYSHRNDDGNSHSSQIYSGSNVNNPMRVTDDDQVMVYILHASLLSKMKRLKEANRVLSEAKILFSGSSNPYQEVQILICSSQLAIDRNDYDQATRILDKIATDNPIFHKVQMIKAEILFNYQRDREGYIRCYKLLLEKAESEADQLNSQVLATAYVNLGDAYLRVLNPELAVDSFESAYKYDCNNNVQIRAKIGKALVATHEYHRAVDFYEAALRDISKQQNANNKTGGPEDITVESVVLSHDLAKLYSKLGRYESANRVLMKVLHDDSYMNRGSNATSFMKNMPGAGRISEKQDDIKTLTLLIAVLKATSAEEGEEARNNEDILLSRRQIKKLQQEVLVAVRSGATAVAGISMAAYVEQEKVRLSTYCVDLAEALGGSSVEADTLFQEALQSNAHNAKAMLGLARLHKSRGDLHGSVAQCRKVAMGMGPDSEGNDEAVTMLSENLAILHQQQLQRRYEEMEEGKDDISATPVMDPEDIVKPLKDFLKVQPNNYKVLERLIVVLRRMGLLDEIPAYLEAAEKNDKRSAAHSGYHYCKGLYARYTNDVIQAIQHFNLSRKDIKTNYGEDSLIHMVELYLNPDQDGIWTSAIEEGDRGNSMGDNSSSSNNVSESTLENIRVADVLLQELRPICRDKRRLIVLENYCLMATRLKHKIDTAMNSFIELLESDPEYLPGILGMATGFMLDKNQHKARNILKRVGKMDMLGHDGEDFEKANLFLAKFSADKTKNDNQTQELCKKCLVNNKSCSQAWDILGSSYERDTDYIHACECYEKAFKLEFEASAPMGFKYAYCLYKNKQHVEAIDVCEKVLAMYPDYPRIREEILKKCILGIRNFDR